MVFMTEIMVFRHGQSVADIEKKCEGRADFPLTSLGMEQARALAEWMNERWRPDAIYCSPLKRAKETAGVITRVTGVEVRYDDDLMERNNGVIAGMPIEEARRLYPIPPEGHKRHYALEGGETEIQFRARAETFISKLQDDMIRHPERTKLCIVCHGGTITMLFRSFLNLPYDSNVVLRTGDSGFHLWAIDNGNKLILATNSQEHLPHHLRL